MIKIEEELFGKSNGTWFLITFLMAAHPESMQPIKSRPPKLITRRKDLEKLTGGLFQDWNYVIDSNLQNWFLLWEAEAKKTVRDQIRTLYAKIKVEPTGGILIRFSFNDPSEDGLSHLFVRVII